MTGIEDGRLGGQADVGGGRGAEEGQLVEGAGQPAGGLIVGGVEAVDAVVDGVFPEVDFLGEGPLEKLHEGTPHRQVIVYLVVRPQTQHRLGLQAEDGIVLKTDVDRHAGAQDSVIEDTHPPGTVVDGVVPSLHQQRAAGRDPHRPLGDVEGPQADLRLYRRFEGAPDGEAVLLGEFLGLKDGRVVQFLVEEAVLYVIRKPVGQVAAEGLQHGEVDLSGRRLNGDAGHEVEHPVGLRVPLHVEPVQVEHPDQRYALREGVRLLGGRCLHWKKALKAVPRVFVLYVQPEVLLVDLVGPDAVDVLHHQVPGRLADALGARLQQLGEEHLVGEVAGVGAGVVRIYRQLTDLKDLPIVLVAVGDGHDLVGLHVDVQGDEAELRVDGVFLWPQLAGRDLLEVPDLLHPELGRLQHRHGPVDVPQVLILGDEAAVQVVRPVLGQGPPITNFLVAGGREGADRLGVRQSARLGQVGEGNDIAYVENLVAVIRDPDFQVLEVEEGVDLGQVLQGGLVDLPVVVAQEEVAVLVVAIGVDFEFLQLRAPLQGDLFAFRLLLRGDGRQSQVAELELRLQSEQRLRALDQASPQWQAHVTGLDLANDVVLSEGLAVVVELDLVVEVEIGPGVVVGVQFKLIADLTGHIHLNVHVEVEDRIAPEALDDEGVILELVVQPETQIHATLRLDADLGAPEEVVDLVGVELNFGQGVDRKAILVFGAHAGQPVEVFALFLLVAVLEVLLEGQVAGGAEVDLAQSLPHDVAAGDRVVLDGPLDVGRVPQVDGIAVGGGDVVGRPVPDGGQRIRHHAGIAMARGDLGAPVGNVGETE